MNKQEFLKSLSNAMSGLPQSEIDGRVTFYAEMIDDKIEEGLSEQEAVAELGNIKDIVSQTLSEIPIAKLVKERAKPKHNLRAWEITLIILGFPVWFPLTLSALAVILAVYIAVWSVIVSLWAVFASFVAAAVAGIAFGVFVILRGDTLKGVSLIGIGIVLSGLSIFMFFIALAATKGVLTLTKKIALRLKSLLIKKG